MVKTRQDLLKILGDEEKITIEEGFTLEKCDNDRGVKAVIDGCNLYLWNHVNTPDNFHTTGFGMKELQKYLKAFEKVATFCGIEVDITMPEKTIITGQLLQEDVQPQDQEVKQEPVVDQFSLGKIEAYENILLKRKIGMIS